MKLRWPVIAAVAPVGLLVGAVLVGRPFEVPNDLRIVEVPTTSTTVPDTEPVEGDSSGAAGVEPVADVQTTSTSAATTTTAPADAFDPASVDLVVANATAVTGVAAATAAELAAVGFTSAQTTDSAPAATSTIYTKPGFDGAGAAIALALGLDPTAVQPYPTTAITVIDDTGDVIVVIGADRAG